MAIALLSDIHANLEALEACLKHARERGAARYAFLGDVVGYGADPQAAADTVRRYAAEGALAVQGNHDAAIGRSAGYLNDAARVSIDWTRKVLGAEHKAFLAALPLQRADGPLCFVHASCAHPERWEYVDSPAAARRSAEAAEAAYVFSGHVHEQVLYFESSEGRWSAFRPTPGRAVPVSRRRRWLAIVGSVGQPRDGRTAAAYALFDAAREELTFHRVAYDHLAAARKIRQAGLPEFHAYRVEHGV
ncbi:MAG: metallophosphoesterase family protein [Betaproteobacteria bacterium]|nr:metallophosphoesterase family protein [Betaproteobacteria bacterium]